MNEMSLSDIAAVTRGNNDEMGGFGSWWIVLVILLMWGRGGWGGNGGGNPVTEADLCSANSFNELKSQIGRMSDQQAAIARQTDNAICNLGYENASLHSQLQAQIANCCCETQRLIERGLCELNYNILTQANATNVANANNTRDIIENQNNNARSILDFLTNDKITTLQAENQSLRLAASQQAQNNYLISQLGTKTPIPAYTVPNPYSSYFNGCGGYCGG